MRASGSLTFRGYPHLTGIDMCKEMLVTPKIPNIPKFCKELIGFGGKGSLVRFYIFRLVYSFACQCFSDLVYHSPVSQPISYNNFFMSGEIPC